MAGKDQGRTPGKARGKCKLLGDSTDNGLMGWAMAGVASVIATLASVVAALFKMDQTKDAQRIEALERSCETLTTEAKECRQDREELRVKIARVEERLAVLDHRDT